jgi:hypothetical protein
MRNVPVRNVPEDYKPAKILIFLFFYFFGPTSFSLEIFTIIRDVSPGTFLADLTIKSVVYQVPCNGAIGPGAHNIQPLNLFE